MVCGRQRFINKFYALCLCVVLAGCGTLKVKTPPRDTHLQPVAFSQLSGWQHDNYLAALTAFRRSCKVFLQYDEARPISKLTCIGGKAQDWQDPCREAMSHAIFSNQQARHFFEKWFTPYEVRNNNGENIGKFTGYYEILLHGSRKKTKRFKYPVYGPPKELDTIKGSYQISRSAINRGALTYKGLELAWVDNAARLFFMHIQGSGIIQLPDGKHMKLAYAGQNGHGYVAIGPLFKEYCKDSIKSATDMMAWMHKHPKIGKDIMERNESYVFFREIHGESPIGAQGVALVPERAIAIDYGLYPYGAPVWIETTLPHTKHPHAHAYHRLMMAQDTGGAIRGAIRADVFFGRGQRAEELAGSMNQKGKYYMLFPKKVIIPKHYKST